MPDAREPAQVPPARDGRRRDRPQDDDSWGAFLVRSVAPGMIATTLVAIGAYGVGWLPLDTSVITWPVVDAMRSTLLGSIVSKGSVIVGVALLLQAWLLLGHDVLRGRTHRIDRLWVALAAWSLPLVLAPPLFSRDVYSYYAQGKLMVMGLDPYTHGSASVPGWFPDGVDPMWAEAPTPYGQVFLLLERGVAAFADAMPYTGAMMFRGIALAGVAMLAWGVPRLAEIGGIAPAKALWLGVLNPLVLMHFVSGCHNDSLMIGLVVVGLVAAASGRAVWGVVLTTLGAAVKPVALVVLPFVGLLWAGSTSGWSRRWRLWVATVAIAGAILVGLAVATRTGVGWISALGTPGAVVTWLSPPTAVALALGAIAGLFGLEITGALVTVCRLIGTAATVAVIAWLCLKPEGRTPVRAAALVMLALVALGPVVQPWYLLWSIPLFAASGLRRSELRIAVTLISILTLWGLVTSSATQDALLKLSDGVALILVAAVVAVILAASPRERRLLLGEESWDRIEPEGPAAIARKASLTMCRPPRR